jgi:hypothetical protein
MSVQIEWRVENTEYDPATHAITTVHWRCIASDGDTSDSVYGSVGLTPDPDSDDFIPFEDLTPDDVLGWVWGSVDKDEQEAVATASLNARLNPSVLSGLPW